jgi:hypothetical protein
MPSLAELAIKLGADGEAQLAAALVNLRGETNRLHQSFQQAQTSTVRLHESFDGLGSVVDRIKVPFAAFAALLAGGTLFKEIIGGAVETAASLEVMRQKTGESIEELSRLRYAADLSHVSAEQLDNGMKFLARSMQAASIGTGPAAKAMEAMGLSIHDATGKLKTLREMLLEVSDKFRSYEDGAAKDALALDIFGRAGLGMIPMLNKGREGIAALEAESDKLHHTMSSAQADVLLQYEASMKRLHAEMQGFGQQIAVAVTPSLMALADAFTTSAADGEKFNIVLELIRGTLRFIAVAVETVRAEFVYFGHIFGNVLALAVGELTDASKVFDDVMSGHFAKVPSDVRTMLTHAKAAGNELWGDMTKDGDEYLAKVRAIFDDEVKYSAIHLKDLASQKKKAPTLGDEKGDAERAKAAYELQMELAKDNLEKQMALTEDYAIRLRDLHGKQDKDYLGAVKETVRIASEIVKRDEAEARGALDIRLSHLKNNLQGQMEEWRKWGEVMKALHGEHSKVYEEAVAHQERIREEIQKKGQEQETSLFDYRLVLVKGHLDKELALWQQRTVALAFIYGVASKEFLGALVKMHEASHAVDDAAFQLRLAKVKGLVLAEIALWKEHAAFLKVKFGEDSKEYLDALKAMEQLGNPMIVTIAEQAQAIGTALESGFKAAFSGKGIVGGIEAFGVSLLGALGGIFTRMGNALVAAAIPFKILAAWVADPLTSGWAMAAAGVALIALGSLLGGIASGGGGGGSVSAGAPPSGVSSTNAGITQVLWGQQSTHVAAGMTPKTPTNIIVIGPSDPQAQRQIQELLDRGARRSG